MSLSGWDADKKLELTIDAADIDSGLTDFPVLINLGSSVGKGSFDASAVFDELTSDANRKKIAVEIGGTGGQCYCEIENWGTKLSQFVYADTDPIAHWTMDNITGTTLTDEIGTYDGTILNMTQTASGKFEKYLAGGSIASVKRSVDVTSVSFKTISFWVRRITVSELEVMCGNQTDVALFYVTATDKLSFWNGAQVDTNFTITDNTAWHHVVLIEGSDNDHHWVWLDGVESSAEYLTNFNGLFTHLGRWAAFASQNTPDFDNVQVYDYILTDAEIASLYASEERTAQLWVKIPSVSASAATILHLYYDSAHADNDTYVGDIGSTPGQNVWDSNFVFVCHQAQDPSGTAPQIKDSTGNAQHGTSYGSMTSGDLVDGLIGKALDYDGSDDYTNHGYDAAHDITDTLTLECAIKPSTLLSSAMSNSASLLSRQHDPTAGQDTYTLQIYQVNGCLLLSTNGGNIQSTKNSWAAGVMFLLAATYDYNSGSEIGDLFVDGIKETLTSDVLDSMAGSTNNLTIGASSSSSSLFSGIIDEVRISNIVRSDDWLTATNLSDTDALITFSLPSLSNVISVLEQTYDLSTAIVISLLAQQYSIATPVLQTLVQTYGLRMTVLLLQRYADTPVVQKLLYQWYGDAHQLTAVLNQQYDDAYSVVASLKQPYEYPAFLKAILEQKYSISGFVPLKVLNQVYSIRNVEVALKTLVQPFSLPSDSTSVISPLAGDGVVLTPSAGGSPVTVGYRHINVESGSDQYCMSCEIHLGTQADYISVNVLDDLTITLQGADYEFFVESKQRRRGHGTAEYSIQGLSKTAMLDSPYAEGITDELSGMASAIVVSLAAGYTVNWNTVDWYIPVNVLVPTDQTPLSIIRDIAAAAGAIVQTEPNGEMTIEPLWPIAIPDWAAATPAYTLSDALDFFNTGEDYEHKPGYNRYLVGDSMTSDQGIRFEEETLSSTTKYVRAYQVPWTGIFDIGHTGCTWVLLSDEGTETRTVEDEVIEFTDGAGSTQYPVYSIVSYEWQCDDLGTLEFEEDGSLTSSVENESILKITYQTKCQKYLVTDPEDEKVQIVAEET